MLVCWKRKIERAQIIFKNSENKKVLEWLTKNGYAPTGNKKPVLSISLQLAEKRLPKSRRHRYPAADWAFVPGVSSLDIERPLKVR